MGATARWLKALVGFRKSKSIHGELETLRSSISSKSKRWLGWKTGSSKAKKEQQGKNKCIGCESIRYLYSEDVDHSCRQFESLKAQWAAIRIQCAFRRLLARKALKALKAIVRIQAIMRGRLVRCQFAKAHHLPIKSLYQDTKRKKWCHHQGSVQEIEARRRHKYDAALRRERALAYSDLHQAEAKRNDFWQSWQREQDEFKVRGMPEIAISYYYSGPILPSLASPALTTALSCAHEHHSKGENRSERDPERMSPSITRPGYMEATISMRAKRKPNLRVGNNLQHLTCHSGYVYPVRRRHSSIAGLDTHHLLLHCR